MKTIVNYAEKVKEQHALNKTLAPVETDLTDASRAYAIGEQFIYDGDLFKAKTAIAQHDALVLDTNYEAADDITTQIKNKTVTTDPVPTEGSTNPVQSNGVYVENRNIYEVMGENGAKNIEPNLISSGTYNTGTITVNEDKSVLINGSFNAVTTLNLDYVDGLSNAVLDLAPYIGKPLIYSLSDTEITGVTVNIGYWTSGGTRTSLDTAVTKKEITYPSGAIKAANYLRIAQGTYDNVTVYPMLRDAKDTDETYQPYAKTNQQLTAENEALTNQVTDISDEIADINNVLGAKNLLPNNAVSRTLNGVTFTVNNDGSITINGTATATTFFYLLGDSINPSGYKLSGNYIASSDNYISENSYLRIGITAGSYSNIREETAMSFPQNSDIYAVVRIASGEIIDNVTLYPMLRLASIQDDTYEPYAKTNQELTAENQTLTNNVSVLAENGAINRLPVDLNKCKALNTTGTWSNNTYTLNGVSFTVNSDSTIAVITEGGGSTALTQFILFESVANWHNMVLSGAPSAASATTYDLAAYDTQTSGENTCRPNPVVLSNITDGHTIRIFIRVRSGQVITEPITFKPMIADANYTGGYVPYAMTNKELTEILSDVGTYNVPVIMGSARNNYVRGAIIYHDKTAKHTVAINEVKQFADSTDYTSQFSVDYSNAGFAIIYSTTVALAGALMNVNVTVS